MADAALVRLSLAEAADRIRRRALSPVELAEAVLAQIDALSPTLNAFTTLVPREQVLAPARAAEREIAAGAYRGLLHGIPVSEGPDRHGGAAHDLRLGHVPRARAGAGR